MMHLDDVGLAVSVTIMTGSKWWVVCRRQQDLAETVHEGDLFCTHSFPLSWHHGSTGIKFLEAEGIHLKAGDIL
jgi:hypothetical protein